MACFKSSSFTTRASSWQECTCLNFRLPHWVNSLCAFSPSLVLQALISCLNTAASLGGKVSLGSGLACLDRLWINHSSKVISQSMSSAKVAYCQYGWLLFSEVNCGSVATGSLVLGAMTGADDSSTSDDMIKLDVGPAETTGNTTSDPKNDIGCRGVDFLFVIDNSGSMGDEQDNLIDAQGKPLNATVYDEFDTRFATLGTHRSAADRAADEVRLEALRAARAAGRKA